MKHLYQSDFTNHYRIKSFSIYYKLSHTIPVFYYSFYVLVIRINLKDDNENSIMKITDY